ncbi:MAG TPA: site-2 protease family protein [Verrucomicrobiales bacterium]|jgi:Zn-dependent protease|nr:site-2 protease family protein [Verrucomicrobiales bacterium]
MIPAPAPPDSKPPGTLPLFTFRGIRVFLHWSWAIVAVWQIQMGRGLYSNIAWDIGVYVSLFAIVLLHEFGHAFATRQVGGTADQILLWPFGGIAYVKTPPRPGAYLWGVAAGPLVNVVLWPVFYFLASQYVDPLDVSQNWRLVRLHALPDIAVYLWELFMINTALIVFNLLPIYPMDGGQILRGLLWYKLGGLRSMYIAAWTGLILGGLFTLYLFLSPGISIFMALMLALMLHQSWMTIQGIRAWRAQNGGRW